jgi:PAS domain S-box-containing protein
LTATPSIRALQEGDAPFVLADHNGNILAINRAFQEVYGWTEEQLLGQPVTLILPESFRMSHVLGFSRYQSTHKSHVLGHPLRLYTVCSDGRELISEHFIIAESGDDGWLFGATLTPLPEDGDADAAIS